MNITATAPGLRKRFDLERKFALIIDESSFGLKMTADICRDFGIGSIVSAKSTESGFASLSATPVDVVICDWGTLALDGPGLARRARASAEEHIKLVPIILLKAQPTSSDVRAAREAGATEVLARPFSAQALINHLTTIFFKPRGFVSTQTFNGPDRRRRSAPEPALSRRKTDGA